MEDSLYDEFGNYVGPDIESEDVRRSLLCSLLCAERTSTNLGWYLHLKGLKTSLTARSLVAGGR